ncbi:hypothetical protein F4811DRAFT_210019 [Daldinia bambusicola]|nr:hypothetical protein F4811DRAFT_210019 [Daldinia bambusicola]
MLCISCISLSVAFLLCHKTTKQRWADSKTLPHRTTPKKKKVNEMRSRDGTGLHKKRQNTCQRWHCKFGRIHRRTKFFHIFFLCDVVLACRIFSGGFAPLCHFSSPPFPYSFLLVLCPHCADRPRTPSQERQAPISIFPLLRLMPKRTRAGLIA